MELRFHRSSPGGGCTRPGFTCLLRLRSGFTGLFAKLMQARAKTGRCTSCSSTYVAGGALAASHVGTNPNWLALGAQPASVSRRPEHCASRAYPFEAVVAVITHRTLALINQPSEHISNFD